MIVSIILVVFVCRFVAVQSISPTIHTLVEVNLELEKEFQTLDENKNGLIDLQEFDKAARIWDRDSDGCVTLSEYFVFLHVDSLKLEWALFNHFDHNQDGCLEIQDMIDEYHEIDVNPKDGAVTVKEYDAYYDKLLELIGFVQQS